MAFIAENHDFKPFEKKVWLSSPTMHGPELTYMKEAFDTNWMSTVGENINECEKLVADKVGCTYAVALSSGTAALHLATKLVRVKPGDVVQLTDRARASLRCKAALEAAESRGFPEWISVDIKEGKGTFKAMPQRSELPATLNEGLVIELYSK